MEKINDKRRNVQEHDKKVEDALNLIRDAYDTLNEEKNGLVSVHKTAVDKLKTLQEKHEVLNRTRHFSRNGSYFKISAHWTSIFPDTARRTVAAAEE